jgi:hypothetical protein
VFRSTGRVVIVEMVDRVVGRLETTHGCDTRAEDMVGDGNRVNERGQVGGGTGNGAEGCSWAPSHLHCYCPPPHEGDCWKDACNGCRLPLREPS